MTGMESKSFDAPEETRPFVDKGMAQVVTLSGTQVLKGRFDPGWRWSEHVRPLAGTDSSPVPALPLRHLGAHGREDGRRHGGRDRAQPGHAPRSRARCLGDR